MRRLVDKGSFRLPTETLDSAVHEGGLQEDAGAAAAVCAAKGMCCFSWNYSAAAKVLAHHNRIGNLHSHRDMCDCLGVFREAQEQLGHRELDGRQHLRQPRAEQASVLPLQVLYQTPGVLIVVLCLASLHSDGTAPTPVTVQAC